MNIELSPTDLENYRKYIRQICGLCIPQEKGYLIQQRLAPLLEMTESKSFSELFEKLKESKKTYLRDQVIAAITTNETSFFRDRHPFETIRKHILPKLAELAQQRTHRKEQRKGSKVHIWSAGASTGQEAFSIAFLIHDFCCQHSRESHSIFDFGILASDISSQALAKAISGEYSESDVARGLPEKFRKQYFEKVGKKWIVKEEIRNMVEFRRLNLIDSFTLLGTFDLILCRNVLIYFDEEIKRKILDQFHQILAKDGTLILGASEIILGNETKFSMIQMEQTVLYKKSE